MSHVLGTEYFQAVAFNTESQPRMSPPKPAKLELQNLFSWKDALTLRSVHHLQAVRMLMIVHWSRV